MGDDESKKYESEKSTPDDDLEALGSRLATAEGADDPANEEPDLEALSAILGSSRGERPGPAGQRSRSSETVNAAKDGANAEPADDDARLDLSRLTRPDVPAEPSAPPESPPDSAPDRLPPAPRGRGAFLVPLSIGVLVGGVFSAVLFLRQDGEPAAASEAKRARSAVQAPPAQLQTAPEPRNAPGPAQPSAPPAAAAQPGPRAKDSPPAAARGSVPDRRAAARSEGGPGAAASDKSPRRRVARAADDERPQRAASEDEAGRTAPDLAGGERQAPASDALGGESESAEQRNVDRLLDEALAHPAEREARRRREQALSAEEALAATPSREDVTRALTVLLPAIRGCAQGQSGLATAAIVVRSSGKVASVSVSGAPFAGTASGRCMEGVLRRARFPRFSQPTFRVKFPLAIQ